MKDFIFQEVWLVFMAGIALWTLANYLYKKQKHKGNPSFICDLLSYLGIFTIGFSVYAGFWGPVRIGPITINKLSFAPDVQKSNSDAYAYACANLKITSSPASGWRGSSKTALAYTVRNIGSREVVDIKIRFRPESSTGGQQPIDVLLSGPFPSGGTVTKIVNVPDNASRSYFQMNLPVGPDHIIAARF